MKTKTLKPLILILIFIGLNLITKASFSQSFCDSTGNVIIYSNYDGGILKINVDEIIPNLKIGVVGYETDSIILSGTFATYVTEIRFAGYNATNNHCGFTTPTVIVGAQTGTDTIIFAPPVTISNPNGNNSIICNYSCDTATSQGGCNTPDQIADYFLQNFGGSLRFHKTQYNCWTGTQSISAGGNCCIGAIFTGFTESDSNPKINIYPNPANSGQVVEISLTNQELVRIDLYNTLGSLLYSSQEFREKATLNYNIEPGLYIIHVISDGDTQALKLMVK